MNSQSEIFSRSALRLAACRDGLRHLLLALTLHTATAGFSCVIGPDYKITVEVAAQSILAHVLGEGMSYEYLSRRIIKNRCRS